MKKLSLPPPLCFALAIFIFLGLSGCTTIETVDGVKYINFSGSAYSVATPDFTPTSRDVVSVYCKNDSLTLRRAIEEAVTDSFALKGIKCVMFSDYSAGRSIEDLSEEEYSDIQMKLRREGVKYYINISMDHYATYSYGGGIANAEFGFNIRTDKQVLTGSLNIQETAGNEWGMSYLTSLRKVALRAGDLVAKEYAKYCIY